MIFIVVGEWPIFLSDYIPLSVDFESVHVVKFGEMRENSQHTIYIQLHPNMGA